MNDILRIPENIQPGMAVEWKMPDEGSLVETLKKTDELRIERADGTNTRWHITGVTGHTDLEPTSPDYGQPHVFVKARFIGEVE